MYAKTMGIYWLLVGKIRISRYLISENRRLSKYLITFTQVRILNLFKNKLNVWISILGAVTCVRWSPSGDKLASVSWNQTKLLDFKTGKVLYTGNTSDQSKFSLLKCMIVIQKSYRRSLFSMLHLDNSKGPENKNYSQESRPSLKIQIMTLGIRLCNPDLRTSPYVWIFLFSFVLIVSKKPHLAKSCRTINK